MPRLRRAPASVGFIYHTAGYASCVPTDVNLNTLTETSTKVVAASTAMTRSLNERHPDYQTIANIVHHAHLVSSHASRVFDFVVIANLMKDIRDRSFVDDFFQKRIGLILKEADISARAIDGYTGFLRTAGPAAQATALSAQVSSFQAT